jgi:hypothetical protein
LTNEEVGQPVGFGIKLAVGKSGLLKDQGACLRAAPDLGLKESRQGSWRQGMSCLVPLDQDLRSFCGSQKRQVAYRLIRISSDRPEKSQEPLLMIS